MFDPEVNMDSWEENRAVSILVGSLARNIERFMCERVELNVLCAQSHFI